MPALAVLPFANLTGDPARDYLGDGIVTERTVALSRIPAVFVISFTSSLALKDHTVTLTDLGQTPGVRYILDGGVQLSGDQIRRTTRLTNA